MTVPISKFHEGTFGASATMFCRHNMSDQRVRGFPHGQRHRLEDGCGDQRGLTITHCALRTDGKERGRRASYRFTDRTAQWHRTTLNP